jgi:hypothetical protein
MPVGREGQLSSQQSAKITTFLLQVNRCPAGEEELPGQSMTLKQIKFLTEKP